MRNTSSLDISIPQSLGAKNSSQQEGFTLGHPRCDFPALLGAPSLRFELSPDGPIVLGWNQVWEIPTTECIDDTPMAIVD
jgi:hypothetical protein